MSRFLPLLLLISIIVVLTGSTSAGSRKMQIVYCPAYFYKGELGIVRLKNWKKNRKYELVIFSSEKRTYQVGKVSTDLLFLVAFPEDAKDQTRFFLYENGAVVYSNEMTIYERQRKEISFSLDNKFIAPDPALGPRLQREAGYLYAARVNYTNLCFFDETPEYPVTNKRTGSQFGERRTLNGVKQSTHFGLDISSQKDSLVRTVFPGKVILAKELYFAGNTVMVQHGLGLVSQYSHLSRILVKEGDQVTDAQLIGYVGSTGMSTGPHLHLSFYYRKFAVDPMSIFSYMKEFR